jgi:hypothetical protein
VSPQKFTKFALGHPHLASPIKGEESGEKPYTFPSLRWEGLGEGEPEGVHQLILRHTWSPLRPEIRNGVSVGASSCSRFFSELNRHREVAPTVMWSSPENNWNSKDIAGPAEENFSDGREPVGSKN